METSEDIKYQGRQKNSVAQKFPILSHADFHNVEENKDEMKNKCQEKQELMQEDIYRIISGI